LLLFVAINMTIDAPLPFTDISMSIQDNKNIASRGPLDCSSEGPREAVFLLSWILIEKKRSQIGWYGNLCEMPHSVGATGGPVLEHLPSAWLLPDELGADEQTQQGSA
jgi:hypothetical protein